MGYRQMPAATLIGFLLLAAVGCSGASDPANRGSEAGAEPSAITAAQAAAFSEALSRPALGLFKSDWKQQFAAAVMPAFGPEKASLEEAREVRKKLLAELQDCADQVRACDTPYIPEAWAFRQAILSLLGSMRDVSATSMDEIITIALNDSLTPEEKTDRCNQIHLRQDRLVESVRASMEAAGAAWEKYERGCPD